MLLFILIFNLIIVNEGQLCTVCTQSVFKYASTIWAMEVEEMKELGGGFHIQNPSNPCKHGQRTLNGDDDYDDKLKLKFQCFLY